MMDDVKAYPPYLDYPKPRKTTTNADRIRAMSDEELAKLFDSDDVIVRQIILTVRKNAQNAFLNGSSSQQKGDK